MFMRLVSNAKRNKFYRFSRSFRYLYVSELGGQKGRPHFHVLFFIPKYKDDNEYTPLNLEREMYDAVFHEWRRNYGSNRNPIYKPLFTFKQVYCSGVIHRNFDLHYVIPTSDSDASSVAFYVMKYMLKPSDKLSRLQQALHLNLPPDEYESVWSIVKTRLVASKGLGLNLDEDGNIDPLILEHLRKSITLSTDFPKFFNPKDGKSFPLSRYYRSRGQIYTLDDALRFYFDSNSENLDSPVIPDVKDLHSKLFQEYSHEKHIRIAADSGVMDNETFDDD